MRIVFGSRLLNSGEVGEGVPANNLSIVNHIDTKFITMQ